MVKVSKFIFWTPRILLIIFALFLAIFSLDIFGNDYTFWETIVGLFMHNLPSLILVAILIISWRRELVGAIIFLFLGCACVIGTIVVMLVIPEAGKFNPISIIGSVVFLFIGILFLIGYKQRKKNKK